MERYLEKVNAWLNSSVVDEKTKEIIRNMDEKELQDSFYRDLEFGTGGLRGVMGPGTNRMNEFIVKRASLGFGRYLLKLGNDTKEKGVVIAHDNRFNHDEFTLAAASALTSLGIKVFIFDALRPTPELSFAVRYLHAAGGINITASHNPKEYNGYKIYNDEGNQLILEQSNKVLAEINAITDELNLGIVGNDNLITVLNHEVDEAFYQMVMDTQINKDEKKDNFKVVYSPQHGAGYVPVTTVLNRLGYKVIEVKEQCAPLGGFDNTKSPNPEEDSAYDLALEYAKKNDADLVVCTDPDSDRVGIVAFDDNKPVYMTGNQIGALLIDYILSSKKANGTLDNNSIIYNTIVSSPLGGIIANSYGVAVEQTLTGFKYIGDKIARAIENHGKTFIMGYEESYGYLLNSQVRDKDAVQSVTLIVEMANYYKNRGITLYQKYIELEKKFGYFVESQVSYKAPGKEGLAKIAAIMEDFRARDLKEIAGEMVVISEDYKSLIRKENGKESHLEYENSNVLRYVFDDGSFVAVRPSGTEPKIKFYFAVRANSEDAVKQRHETIKNFILDLTK